MIGLIFRVATLGFLSMVHAALHMLPAHTMFMAGAHTSYSSPLWRNKYLGDHRWMAYPRTSYGKAHPHRCHKGGY